MKKLYDSVKTGLKTVALSALMAYSLTSCDKNNYLPLNKQVAKTVIEQQSIDTKHKIDSLETIALKDINIANKYFNNAVSKKNIDEKTLKIMDAQYSHSRKEYSMIEDIADKFNIKKYPKINPKIKDFSNDVSDIINGFDTGKTTIEYMLEKQGIKNVKVYNPGRNKAPIWERLLPISPVLLLFGSVISDVENDKRKERIKKKKVK